MARPMLYLQPFGFRTSETDPLGNVTQWEPDRMNRLVKKTLASGSQYGYAYDVLGRVTASQGRRAAA